MRRTTLSNELNVTQKKILRALRTHRQISPTQLKKISKQKNISPRISELRHLGYNIQLIKGRTNKYSLLSKSKKKKPSAKLPSTVNNILSWINNHNLYDRKINYDTLSQQLNLPKEEIINAMITIYKKGILTQMNNNEVIIHKL